MGMTEDTHKTEDTSWTCCFHRDGYLVVEEFVREDELHALRHEGARLAREDEASAQRRGVAALASRTKQEHQDEDDAMNFVKSASGVTCFYEKDGETVNKVGHALHDKIETFRRFSRSERVKNLLRYGVQIHLSLCVCVCE